MSHSLIVCDTGRTMADSDTSAESFEATFHKTNVMIRAVEERFGWEDRAKAYAVLRAVLHTLRDRLTVDNVAHLAAQLPMLVRGFYYEGWVPAHAPQKMNAAEFIGEVERQIDPLSFGQATEEVIRGVVAIIQDYTDPDEVRKLKATLPKDIQSLLTEDHAHG